MDPAVGHGLTPTGLAVVVEEQRGIRALPSTGSLQPSPQLPATTWGSPPFCQLRAVTWSCLGRGVVAAPSSLPAPRAWVCLGH